MKHIHQNGPAPHVKRGGRRKGTPNKSTLDFQQKLKSLNIDLLGEIFKIIKDDSPQAPTKSAKLNAMISMLNYIFPTRKALSLSPEEEEMLKYIKELAQMAKDDIQRVIKNALKESKGGWPVGFPKMEKISK